jgi:hypothetical protein
MAGITSGGRRERLSSARKREERQLQLIVGTGRIEGGGVETGSPGDSTDVPRSLSRVESTGVEELVP